MINISHEDPLEGQYQLQHVTYSLPLLPEAKQTYKKHHFSVVHFSRHNKNTT